MINTVDKTEISKKFGNYPVYLNVVTLNGRQLIKRYFDEESIIKLTEKLCDDLITYTVNDIGEPVEVFDIAIKAQDDIYSLRTLIEQCEEDQFEDTLEILLDNSQE